MRRRFVAGNWKMHGSTAANRDLLAALVPALEDCAGVEMVVCPPFPYLHAVGQRVAGTPLALGAQNVSEHDSGAYTGEVAASMLVDCGCRYVIVGHSERRSLHGESDKQVAAKFVAAQRAGLTPILCLGERLEERERGDTNAVVARQLQAVLDAAGVRALAGAVVAYEPVWAIGTGKTATPAQAGEVHAFLRERVASADRDVAADLRIVYGGSVKAGNAAELFRMPDIDGGLIGGASLIADEFVAICRAALRNRE